MSFKREFSKTISMKDISASTKASLIDPNNTNPLTNDESTDYGSFNQYSISNNSDVVIKIALNDNPTNTVTIPAGTFTNFIVERENELTKNNFLDISIENMSSTTSTGAGNIIVEISKVIK